MRLAQRWSLVILSIFSLHFCLACGASTPEAKVKEPVGRIAPVAPLYDGGPNVFYMMKAHIGESSHGVKYFDAREQLGLKIYVQNGLLVDAKGRLLDPKLGSFKGQGRIEGKAIFVMDLQEDIFATFEQRYGRIHHSSLNRGQPVLSAGELYVSQGKLLAITNKSGHYRPDAKSLQIVIDKLKKLGADLSQLEYKPYQKK